MLHGPQAGIAGQATRLAVRAVLLAAVAAAVVTPAIADAASVAYVDKGEVWLASLDGAKKARLATPVVNGDGDTENWIDIAQSDGGRIVAVRNKPGRDLEPLVVQDLGARWDLHRRGTAQRPGRLGRVRLSPRLRHHRGRVAPRLRILEHERLLPDHGRARHVRPAGDQQRARSDRHRRPDAPLALRRAGHLARGLLVADDRQRPGRGRRQPLHERLHPVARQLGGGARARGRRRRGQRAHWRRSGSRPRSAARRRSARSPSSPSRGWIRCPRSPPPWTASCPRPASHGTHRSRRTPARSHGRTTAA